jgi:iron(II)-dependent oxidoreductase
VRASATQSTPPGGVESLPKQQIGELLVDARARTLALVEPLSDADLNRVHDPLMSPLVWDLGHIAAFEDLWLCRRIGELELLRPELAEVYDAAETPRADRGELPYLRRGEAIAYMDEVRERALEVLERTGGEGPLWDMIIQHEQQHNETMLQTLQLAQAGVYTPNRQRARSDDAAQPRPLRSVDASPAGQPRPDPESGAPASVLIEAGPFLQGDAGEGFAYDNERPQHELQLPAFRIDRTPVTCTAYREFVEDGGYRRRELWSPAGWELREHEGWERPLYWTADGQVRSFERTEQPPPEQPVMNVSCYEAEAFARWRGARLPSEAEWEKAARTTGEHPGNLDQLDFGPGCSGAFVGDCWEWTASEFAGYPGFVAYPYAEYSKVFFGAGYRVLRGASWATRPRVARVTFRNWDHPQRRQIFAGFRCAEEA